MNKEDILSEIYESGEEIDEFTFRDPVTNTEERYILFDTPWEYAVVQIDYDPTTKKIIKEDVISIAPKDVYSYSEVVEKFETLKKKLQTESTESAEESTESYKESTESAEELTYECHWCGYRIRSRRKPELCPVCKWHVFRIIE
jgi:rubrerythrin